MLNDAFRSPGDAALALLAPVTGHLRHRPDPAAERRLRAVFAELDRELAAALGDRCPAALPGSGLAAGRYPAVMDFGPRSRWDLETGAAIAIGRACGPPLPPPRFFGSVSRRSARAGHICTAC